MAVCIGSFGNFQHKYAYGMSRSPVTGYRTPVASAGCFQSPENDRARTPALPSDVSIGRRSQSAEGESKHAHIYTAVRFSPTQQQSVRQHLTPSRSIWVSPIEFPQMDPPPSTEIPEPIRVSEPDPNNEEHHTVTVRKDREEWSESAISTLIEAYTTKYSKLNGKGLRGKDWAEVVEAVNSNHNSTKTVEHCRNKMDTLTKRYKSEKKNKLSGIETSWPWYDRMEVIRGCSTGKSGGAPQQSIVAKDKTPASRKKGKKAIEAVTIHPDDSIEAANARIDMLASQALHTNWSNSTPTVAATVTGVAQSTISHITAAATAAQATCEATKTGSDGDLCRSVLELAASLKSAAGTVASSMNGFTEVYARIEIAKMEMLKELELKRMQMQLDTAELMRDNPTSKRKRETSSDHE